MSQWRIGSLWIPVEDAIEDQLAAFIDQPRELRKRHKRGVAGKSA